MPEETPEPTPRAKVTERKGPFHYIYGARNPQDDTLATRLMLMYESLFADRRPEFANRPPMTHAVSADAEATPMEEDGEWLREIRDFIERKLEERPGRREWLSKLPGAFGDGELLKILFRNLFPEARSRPVLDHAGRPVLTEREVQILSEAATGATRKEIAARLSTPLKRVTTATVNKHFENIYNKLGVSDSMQAVSRAIAMRYLDMDVLEQVRASCSSIVVDYGVLGSVLVGEPFQNSDSAADRWRELAACAMFLLASCGNAATVHREDNTFVLCPPRGLIYQLDASGHRVQSFGTGVIQTAYGIAIAPAEAKNQGFIPGNIFVSHLYHPVQGVNGSAISEFTPEGEYLRTFIGSEDIARRLVGVTPLRFHTDGRLLAAPGVLTDAILAFSDDGKTVDWLASGCFRALGVSGEGEIYAAQYSSTGSAIVVRNGVGRLLRRFGEELAGTSYVGAALNTRGHLFVHRMQRKGVSGLEKSDLVEFGASGKIERILALPDRHDFRLAIDSNSQIFAADASSCRIYRVSSEGELYPFAHVAGMHYLYDLIVDAGGNLWVCGQAA